MHSKPFYQAMRRKSDRLWNAIFEFPIILGIGNRILARDRFEFYLKQDYIYLIDFPRLLAIASN